MSCQLLAGAHDQGALIASKRPEQTTVGDLIVVGLPPGSQSLRSHGIGVAGPVIPEDPRHLPLRAPRPPLELA
eukprot:3180883-Pyramimonas_sp.AAC.1